MLFPTLSRKGGSILRAALYLYTEQEGGRWQTGLTLSPTVTRWWIEEKAGTFAGLLTPPLPLYFALYLHERIGGDHKTDSITGLSLEETRMKIGQQLRKAREDVDRELHLHTEELWAKGAGKSFPGMVLPLDPDQLRMDMDHLLPLLQGRLLLLDQLERLLDRKEIRLAGETMEGLGGISAIHPRMRDEEAEMNRKLVRREYLLSLMQYLYHEKKIRLTSGIRIVEQGGRRRIRCERCDSLYDRWQGSYCGICEHEDMVCETCLTMGASKGCKAVLSAEGLPTSFHISLAEQASFLQWEGELTPAQQSASETAVQFVLGSKGLPPAKELLIHAVTGAGKTEVVFRAIDASLQRGERVLIATPRKDVVLELAPRFQRAFPTLTVYALYGGSSQNGEMGQLMIATTHQTLHFYHAFQLIIVDEIDAFPYNNQPMLHFGVERALQPGGRKILLTATPSPEILQRVRMGKTIRTTIPCRHHGHPLPIPEIHTESGLHMKLDQGKLPKGIIRFLEDRVETGRQTLLFVPRIDMVNRMVKLIRKNGPKMEGSSHFSWVEGVYASDPEREEKVNAFRKGEIRLLVTTTILERGVTIPSLDVLVLMADAPIFEESALIQIAGRVGRLASDPEGKVVFLAEHRTEAMVSAIRHLQRMNREAERKGFLITPVERPSLINQLRAWMNHLFEGVRINERR